MTNEDKLASLVLECAANYTLMTSLFTLIKSQGNTSEEHLDLLAEFSKGFYRKVDEIVSTIKIIPAANEVYSDLLEEIYDKHARRPDRSEELSSSFNGSDSPQETIGRGIVQVPTGQEPREVRTDTPSDDGISSADTGYHRGESGSEQFSSGDYGRVEGYARRSIRYLNEGDLVRVPLLCKVNSMRNLEAVEILASPEMVVVSSSDDDIDGIPVYKDPSGKVFTIEST